MSEELPDGLPFGPRAVSWRTVWDALAPDADLYEPDGRMEDRAAAEMQRLRGQIVLQAAETESVLVQILRRVGGPGDFARHTAGKLVSALSSSPLATLPELDSAVDVLKRAVRRRNRAVHDRVDVAFSWLPYATGGGEWTEVASFLGDEECSEHDLLRDLQLQQEATIAAVQLLMRSLEMGPRQL